MWEASTSRQWTRLRMMTRRANCLILWTRFQAMEKILLWDVALARSREQPAAHRDALRIQRIGLRLSQGSTWWATRIQSRGCMSVWKRSREINSEIHHCLMRAATMDRWDEEEVPLTQTGKCLQDRVANARSWSRRRRDRNSRLLV